VNRVLTRSGAVIVLFSMTLFVNAALLFAVQPMFSKMVLPMLGGTPSVWNTCMLFFQAALLGGYLYAHVTSRLLDVRKQSVLQLALFALTFLTLPVAVATGWRPTGSEMPVWWLAGLLSVSLGAPFFMLSTGAPLLQRWFSESGHPAAANPYFLYAASNLGSMVALVSYPIAIEPTLRLEQQSRLWTGAYVALAALVAVCAFVVRRRLVGASVVLGDGTTRTVAADATAADIDALSAISLESRAAEHLTVWRRTRWVLLSFVPSSMLLAVTTYLSTDVAAIPLLWIVPLAIYLLTFVMVFARRVVVFRHAFAVWLQPPFLLILAVSIALMMQRSVTALAPTHLAAFFLTALVCHGELAKDRPSVAHLTEFYLWMSVGGVLGGIFNVIVAPHVFDTVLEYPIAIILAAALRPTLGTRGPYARMLDLLLPFLLCVLIIVLMHLGFPPAKWGDKAPVWVFGAYAIIALTFQRHPIRFALGTAAIFIGATLGRGEDKSLLFRGRSFFGVYRVMAYPKHHALQNGTTTHGGQSIYPQFATEPLTYYHRDGPLGQSFASLMRKNPDRHVAIVGLGTGTIACYGHSNEKWTFYEIDPLIERIAFNPKYFSYLRDCPPAKRIVLGDARLSLQQAPDSSYDFIILDAFSSDAIPVHLMTREALQLYLRKLAPGGSIAFHISNRYLNLEPVLVELARDARIAGIVGADTAVTPAMTMSFKMNSKWVVLSRSAQDHASLAVQPGWRVLRPKADVGVWTDDFSNVFSVFRWR
jgi:spermidine synthase